MMSAWFRLCSLIGIALIIFGSAAYADPPTLLGQPVPGAQQTLIPVPPLPAAPLIDGARWEGLITRSADLSQSLEFKSDGEPGQPVRVIRLVLSQWWTNCYILIGAHNQAIVIDPADTVERMPGTGDHFALTGVDANRLLDTLHANHLTVKYIVSTHGHLDHVSGATGLKKAFPDCIFCMGSGDIDADGRPKDSHMFDPGLPKVDRRLKDGDTIECDGIKLRVLTTPGHSPGSLCFRCGNWLFSGDTLFYHLAGRVNFHDGSGSWPEELKSIKTKLYTLPPATLVLPGHYWFTTIGEEKANNLSTAGQ